MYERDLSLECKWVSQAFFSLHPSFKRVFETLSSKGEIWNILSEIASSMEWRILVRENSL